MNEFRFAEMAWLHATWGVLACAALLVVFELRGRSLLDRMLSPWMQSRLVRRSSLLRRLSRITLFTLALMALVFALMQPQWGMTVQAQTRVDSQIMVCLDVSKSMLAEDVVPNRLERAKAEIDSMLSLMDDGQQVGLTVFAGKASVLCPMTTDFGFLRLVLTEAGPAIVGLGGTRIGEALQKAVAGFRQTGDMNRLILLITDGEDHDSFPLDAAKLAKEKGVRIVSIGFGDEAGSKIELTDRETGARKLVTDRNGVAVVSRLDGDTLRDIALETEGAYIPAGTGALDLQSIYDAHIRTLLQGSSIQEDRIVRNEAYQWCVLTALILFVASMLVTTSGSEPLALASGFNSQRPVASGVLIVIAFCCLTGCENGRDAEIEDASRANQTELAPRELYNRAVSFVGKDPERAEQLLTESRQSAGVDGELRFRSLFNLGWVEITRADQLLDAEPAQALQHLQMAASRFREAIRVRSEDADARHNLEVISRRILELADSLAKRDPEDLAKRLDQLITMQRAHQAQLQQMTSCARPDESDPRQLRSAFRQLGVTQRQVISDMEKFAADARQELAGLEQDKSDSQENETQVRSAQLSGMLGYIDMSVQRMSKARSFTRRSQPERAFIRWAAALTAAKRGRDQLRNPVEVLGVLISDASELAKLTQSLSFNENAEPATEQPANASPSWLTGEYLHETQVSTTQRTAELLAILSAGVQQLSTQPAEPNEDGSSQAMIDNVRSALPSIELAVGSFTESEDQLEKARFTAAFENQSEAISALMDAAEFFYDLRRLVEVIYGDERRLQAVAMDLAANPRAGIASTAEQLQAKNLTRAVRLGQLLDDELGKLEPDELGAVATSATSPPTPPANAEQLAAQKQRLELAKPLLVSATQQMAIARKAFVELPAALSPTSVPTVAPSSEERPPSPLTTKLGSVDEGQKLAPAEALTHVQRAETALAQAIEDIEELRRLFFSVVEHLRETAQRQAELNDNTLALAGSPQAADPTNLGPLHERQLSLQQMSEQIASVLLEQSEREQQPTASNAVGNAPDQQNDSENLAKAAELVQDGSNAMQNAGTQLQIADEPKKSNTDLTAGDPKIDFEAVITQQKTALEKLAEALALLDDQQSGENQEQQQDEQQNQEEDGQQEPEQQNMNASQMMQAIREREAQRRKDKQRANVHTSSAVEKDW